MADRDKNWYEVRIRHQSHDHQPFLVQAFAASEAVGIVEQRMARDSLGLGFYWSEITSVKQVYYIVLHPLLDE